MPRDISQNARNEVYATEMLFTPLIIIEIEHVDLSENIYVVNNNEDIVFEGDTYKACSFSFTPPSQEDGQVQPARISICNIDRSLVLAVRSLSSPPSMKAQVILVGNTVEAEAGPWEFILRNVSYTKDTISGSLEYDFKQKQKLSTIRVNYVNFPSLVGA